MFPSINEIYTCQYAPTQEKMDKCNQVLDCTSTHPNENIHYHASDMIFITDTDAAYLVLPEARIRISGYYYFTNRMLDYSRVTPTPNVPILTEYRTLKTVVSSSAKSETGGTIENAQNVIPLRYILETFYLHHKPTKVPPTITENLTSQGIITYFIKPCKLKILDMRYHCLEYRNFQKYIQLKRKQGIRHWDF